MRDKLKKFPSFSSSAAASEQTVFRRRMGIIFSNVFVFSSLLCLCGLFAFFGMAAVFLIWLSVIVLTVGLLSH